MPPDRKAMILEGMVRRRQWGMNYRPLEETASKLPDRDRREALEVIDHLVQEGLAQYHKNRSCVSLVSSRKREVEHYLREHGDVPDWILDSLI